MAYDDNLEAFKNVATTQGYDPAEVESFVAMAKASNERKRQKEEEDRQRDLADYESKLKLQQQYSTTTPSPKVTLETPSSSGQTYLQEVVDDKGNFVDIIRNNPQLGEEEILTLARANVNKYGPFKESAQQLRQMGLGMIVDAGLSAETTADPLEWAADNQAFKYLTGKTKDERTAQAAAMQQLGVEGYLNSSALPDLLTDKELEARESALSTLNAASSLISQIESKPGGNLEGLGPGGRFKPGLILGSEGTTARQAVTSLTAKAMQEISGKVISDNEVKRLSASFPQIGDTEENIAIKSKNIMDAIEIGMQMQEIAKRERLTLDEAYSKYGAQAFQAKGQTVPGWIENKDKPGLNIGNNNNNDLMDKYW